MLHTCLTWICCQFEKSNMTEELVKGVFFFFGNYLVNYKYITCSLICFLYTFWMCLIQIRQKYIRSSSVGKHNFGFILCFVYQLSTCFCFFVFVGKHNFGFILCFVYLLSTCFWFFLFLEGRGYVNFLLAAYRWLLKFSGCWCLHEIDRLLLLLVWTLKY